MKTTSKYFVIIFTVFIILSTLNISIKPIIAENNISQNSLSFTYSFSTPSIINQNIDDKKITKVKLDDLPLSRDSGQPCLPVKPLRILLPQSTKIKNIKVETSTAITLRDDNLNNIEIAGSPRAINKYSVLDDTIIKPYDTNIIYPINTYENIGVQSFRGWSILHINIYPVKFLGQTNTLYYYPQITINIETSATVYNNLYDYNTKQDIIKMVENPETVDTYTEESNYIFKNPSNYEYVIITTDDLTNISGVSYTFEDLLNYRRNQGLNCTIKTIESIIDEYEGDDTQEKIRNFIKDAYMNWNTRWVLLGGDIEKVPVRYLYDVDGLQSDEDYIASDLYYQCLDGNYNYDGDYKWGEIHDGVNGDPIDLYAEVYIGRAPVDDKDDVSSFVEKTLIYEDSEWNDDDYLKNHLSVSEILWNGPGGYGAGYAERCIDYWTDYNQNTHGVPSYKYSITKLYERDMEWNKYDFMDEINKGVNIINHVSHGCETEASLDISDISGLLNTGEYSLFYSQACHSGSFDKEDECFAERWVNVNQRGGFAAIMNTGYGYGSASDYDGADNRYAREFFDALFSPNEKISRLGKANQDSKEDNIWHINELNMYHAYYDTTLFGDPYTEIKGAEDITADFLWDIIYPVTGQTISFEDKSIGYVSYRLWDFGDGHTSNQKNPVHSYSSPNTYSVSLTVQDNYGFMSTTTEQIQVKDEWSPFAIATPEYYQGYIFTVQFTGDQSFDPDGEIISYHWNFDDGTTSSLVNPNHTFLSEGTYNVEFTVRDNDNNVDKVFCEIVLDFQLPPETPNTPNGPIYTFSGDTDEYTVSTIDPEEDKIKYGWDWGDGTPIEWSEWYDSGQVCTMSHTWNIIGTYSIRVKARDFKNAESDWSNSLEVTIQDNEKPELEIINPEKALYINNKRIIPFFTTLIIGIMEINVSAYDSSGIERVGFYIDGEPKGEALSKPYIFTWDEFSFGKHTITVVAYDNAENSAEKEIIVWKFF